MTMIRRRSGRRDINIGVGTATIALAGVGIAASMAYALTGAPSHRDESDASHNTRPIVMPLDEDLARFAAELQAQRAAAVAAVDGHFVIPTEEQLAELVHPAAPAPAPTPSVAIDQDMEPSMGRGLAPMHAGEMALPTVEMQHSNEPSSITPMVIPTSADLDRLRTTGGR